MRVSNCKILPIIQVTGIDDDTKTTKSIIDILAREGISTEKIKTIKNIEEAKTVYASLDIMLGMRMHSNVIAATQGIPFVAVSYEYKTEGIAKYLGMIDYCIKQENVTGEKLFELLRNVYFNRVELSARIINSIKTIKNQLRLDLNI